MKNSIKLTLSTSILTVACMTPLYAYPEPKPAVPTQPTREVVKPRQANTPQKLYHTFDGKTKRVYSLNDLTPEQRKAVETYNAAASRAAYDEARAQYTRQADDAWKFSARSASTKEPVYYIGVATSKSGSEGIKILGVTHGSPAQIAGLKVNDVIVSCNGLKLANQKNLVAIIQIAGDQQPLTFKLSSNGATGPFREVKVTPIKYVTKARYFGPAMDVLRASQRPQSSKPSVTRVPPRPVHWVQPAQKADPKLLKRVQTLEEELRKSGKRQEEIMRLLKQQQKMMNKKAS